ncbi:MAG: hypothetical protein H7Y22_19300 [Gemmatimonadaceae bacterium]|nr:hypothetical protein [Gloeobacterales cyanobacterium ES-bin-141]
MKSLQQVRQSDEKRYGVLRIMYDLSRGATSVLMNVNRVALSAELHEGEVVQVWNYLQGAGLAEYSQSSGDCRLTRRGVLEAERDIKTAQTRGSLRRVVYSDADAMAERACN